MSLALGKWLNPYVGIRLNAMGGSLHTHWPTKEIMNHTRYAAVYGDLMWDLTSTLGGYNEKRVVSIIPFAGIGELLHSKILKLVIGHMPFPVSIGMKLNFRLFHYLDFFLEGRANAMGDHFNGVVEGKQVESIASLIGGFTVKFGKTRFKAYDPYADRMIINDLNGKVNNLRSALETCEARECPPCPEVTVTEVVTVPEPVQTCNPDLSIVVRFKINSAVVSQEEMVNVYNIADWMKRNPNCNVTVADMPIKKPNTGLQYAVE